MDVATKDETLCFLILTKKEPTVSASTAPRCRADDGPASASASKAMDRLVGDGDSDEELSALFSASRAGGDSSGISFVLILSGAGGGGLDFVLVGTVSSSAEVAAASAALRASVFALGGRPLPGDLPVPALEDLVALPKPLGDLGTLGFFPLGEAPRGDFDRGRPIFPLGLRTMAGGKESSFTSDFTTTGVSENSGEGGGEVSRSGVPNNGFKASGESGFKGLGDLLPTTGFLLLGERSLNRGLLGPGDLPLEGE